MKKILELKIINRNKVVSASYEDSKNEEFSEYSKGVQMQGDPK